MTTGGGAGPPAGSGLTDYPDPFLSQGTPEPNPDTVPPRSRSCAHELYRPCPAPIPAPHPHPAVRAAGEGRRSAAQTLSLALWAPGERPAHPSPQARSGFPRCCRVPGRTVSSLGLMGASGSGVGGGPSPTPLCPRPRLAMNKKPPRGEDCGLSCLPGAQSGEGAAGASRVHLPSSQSSGRQGLG